MEWEVVRELGSDHFPILIRSGGRGGSEGADGTWLAWDWKGARWEKYREEVRREVGKIDWNRLGPKERERQFRRVVLTAGRKWVGMKRRGGEPRPVNVAQEESRARDELRAQEEVEWETVAAAEASVRAKYREARQQRWRARLQKGATVGAMWDLVRGAGKGRRSGGRRGEGLKVGERVLMTARAKANAFVSMYAKVSRVRVPKGARLKARINSALRSPGPGPEDAAPITPAEVRRALDERA